MTRTAELNRALQDTCEALDRAIKNGFDGFRLNRGLIEDVIAKYGTRHVGMVLACTVAYKAHDGRFSNTNKIWALQTLCSSQLIDCGVRPEWVLESHSCIVDGVIEIVRKIGGGL